MDEPLSNLDAKLRVQTRAEIHQLQRRLGVTTIYVTHDQVEAMTMGDRVAVMSAGRLQQVDTRAEALRPARERVRRRLHRLTRDQPRRGAARADERKPLDQLRRAHAAGRRQRRARITPPEGLRRQGDHPRHPAGGLRGREHRAGHSERSPHEGDVSTSPSRSAPRCSSTSAREATGVVSSAVEADAREDADIRLGGRGRRRRRKTRLCARVSPRSHIAAGQPAELAVDTSRLYFFDPQTRETRLALHGAGGEAGDDPLLQDEDHDDQRQRDDHRRGHDLPPGDGEAAARSG